jgi:hypothetical protein
MTLGFKTTFTDGTPTHFVEKIMASVPKFKFAYQAFEPKIHSLREDPHNRWKKDAHIHMATGVRSNYYKQFNEGIAELEKCKSTQRIFMTLDFALEITVDGKYLHFDEVQLLIKNDGLNYNQFVKWFFPDGMGEWSGKIIHWTDFKY